VPVSYRYYLFMQLLLSVSDNVLVNLIIDLPSIFIHRGGTVILYHWIFIK